VLRSSLDRRNGDAHLRSGIKDGGGGKNGPADYKEDHRYKLARAKKRRDLRMNKTLKDRCPFVAVLTVTESEMFRMWMDARQCEEIPLSKLCSIIDLKAARNYANSVLPEDSWTKSWAIIRIDYKACFLRSRS
jgi:hypothetical protein